MTDKIHEELRQRDEAREQQLIKEMLDAHRKNITLLSGSFPDYPYGPRERHLISVKFSLLKVPNEDRVNSILSFVLPEDSRIFGVDKKDGDLYLFVSIPASFNLEGSDGIWVVKTVFLRAPGFPDNDSKVPEGVECLGKIETELGLTAFYA